MRKKIVAGNWKMNLSFTEADDLLYEISNQLSETPPAKNVDVIVFPPALYVELASDASLECDIYYGAQNCAAFPDGAYTGEISAAMLKSMEATHVIVGHSERRKYFNETKEILLAKIEQALENDIVAVFCCGEQIQERENEKHKEVVKQQLEEVVFKLNENEFENIIIAYEPVWAIGTGKTASAEQAEEMHKYIRNLIAEKYNKELANKTYILYGGSCNPTNAEELFKCANIDGGLIGGASLNAENFLDIIYIAGNL